MKKLKNRKQTFIAMILLFIMTFSFVASAEGIVKSDVVGEASKISSELQTAMTVKSGKMPVMAWLNDIDLASVKSKAVKESGIFEGVFTASTISEVDLSEAKLSEDITMEEVQNYIAKKRALTAEVYIQQKTELAKKIFDSEDVVYISKYSPVAIVELTVDEILKVSQKSDIVSLCFYGNDDESQMSIANQVTNVDEVHSLPQFGYQGNDIKIGLIEMGLPDSVIYSYVTTNGVGEYDLHATQVLATIKDIAPNAQYYVAGVPDMQSSGGYVEAIEWLLDQSVNVINASRSVGAAESVDRDTYTDSAKWLDHIAFNQRWGLSRILCKLQKEQ